MVRIADGLPCKHIKYENGVEVVTYEVATKRYIQNLDIYKKGIKIFDSEIKAQKFYDDNKIKIDDKYIDIELNRKIQIQNSKLKNEKKRLKKLYDNMLDNITKLTNLQKREVYRDMIDGHDNIFIMDKFNINSAQVARMRKYFNERVINEIK